MTAAVVPQGAYAAKRCPLRVQFDAFPPVGVEPSEPSDADQLRMADGNEFEEVVFGLLVDLVPGAVLLSGRGVELEQATLDAMGSGAPVVLGGRLPTDRVGLRVGRPDVLVRAERIDSDRWAYHPVDVKHHIAAVPMSDGQDLAGMGCAPLAAPSADQASGALGLEPRGSRDDLLQLAHYHRMLEGLGHASQLAAGGIIGKEQVVAWHRLDLPVLTQTWRRGRDDRQSVLERYDHEFAFRLDALAAAAAGKPIVEPVATSECDSCPWHEHCWPQLLEADSTSLLPRYGYTQWHALRLRGITSRSDLAELDERTARLLGSVGALAELVTEAATCAKPDAVAIVDLGVRVSPKQRTALEAEGVRTAADLLALDQGVLPLADAPGLNLPDSIRAARVITGDGRPVLRWGVDELEVPAADVEIDIDMENALDGTHYLWGALVDGTYHGFVRWEPPSEQVEAEVFMDLWRWLEQLRSASAARGESVAVYCWSRNAEATALRIGAEAAAATGTADVRGDVHAFLDGDELVDLLVWFRDQVVTGRGNSLKKVAPLAGFDWRDEDPGGEASMLWHQTAIDPVDSDERRAAQRRLLTYNEDDVRATAAIRAWMRSGAITSP